MPQAWPRRLGQLGHGVIDTGFRASDDHRAAAVVDDIDRDLPSHAGAAADNDDLLGLEMHGESLLLIILDDSCWAISTFARQEDL